VHSIEVTRLGKVYRVPDATSRVAPWRRRPTRPFVALDDVSLVVDPGEVLGIVGRNGAGKSTLLKILSRITPPTSGRAVLRGRVASLLEVGTGFHPDLTGRENVFLNAAIHGMSRSDARRRMDSILAFAQVEAFAHAPVKRYSSGMYLRLAFSVAAHLRPDVLIVDEVLAVGDAEFQDRCLGRIDDARGAGATVLFVSHNLHVVERLCRRACWLDEGRVRAEGDAGSVIRRYLTEGGGAASSRFTPSSDASSPFALLGASVRDAHGVEGTGEVPASAAFRIALEYAVRGRLPPGRLAVRVDAEDGRTVFASADTDGGAARDRAWQEGEWISSCEVPAHLLRPGAYRVSVAEPTPAGGYRVHERALSFRVSEQGSLVSLDAREGVVAPLLAWTRERRAQGSPSGAASR
jgi:lipopolysaccharide transport system ATP-binding protein